MRKPLRPAIVALSWIVLAATARAETPAWTAEALAEKNLEARGGAAALAAITTLRRSGTLLVNGGQIRIAYAQLQKRGADGMAMIRDEASLQGLTQVQAWDGVEGWQINPFQGRKTPERVPGDDNKGLIEDADIEGVLIGWQARHEQLSYLGTEDVDGTIAHKLRLDKPGGDSVMVYLDPDYFVEIRTISQRREHGVPLEMQADYGDYEKLAGVYFPFAIVSGRKGSTDLAKLQFEKGEANVDIPDAKFHFPAPNATVGKIKVIESPPENKPQDKPREGPSDRP